MQAIFASIIWIAAVSNFSFTSTLSSFWLLLHQTHNYFFLLIPNSYISEDVINVKTGIKFALFPFVYLPFDKIEYNIKYLI